MAKALRRRPTLLSPLPPMPPNITTINTMLPAAPASADPRTKVFIAPSLLNNLNRLLLVMLPQVVLVQTRRLIRV